MCCGDSHPETPSTPGCVGLVRAHPLTKTQALEPSRQTRSSYGPLYPLRRWSSVAFAHRVVVFVVQRIDRYSYFCAYLVMLLDQGLLSRLDFYLIKERCHFSIRESDGPSRQILGCLIKDQCHFSTMRIRWAESSDFGP